MAVSNRIRQLAQTLFVVVILAVLAVQPAAHSDERESLLILLSRNDGPYEDIASAVRRLLANRGGDLQVTTHSLQTDAERATEALRVARREGSTPIISIGSAASRAALEAAGQRPVIACMTADEEGLLASDNATGVLLEFPIETQLRWMRRLVPTSRAIGVLYSRDENHERLKGAKTIAGKLGLRLITHEIARPQDLPGALNSLARNADMLWGVTDQLVLSRQTSQAVLLFSFRNRIPFSGLSASWVKAGALYALDRDYDDLGTQCGEMAVEVLNGKSASSLPVETPRKVNYTLNLRTAEHLRLEFSRELIKGAVQVFR